MYSNLNLNNLKYFYEIANTRNITKASENLTVSQPALTRAVKQLEDELNVILFHRSKKGVILTHEGEILYEYTKQMFQNLVSTISVINERREDGGHLYIGATTTNFLEPILPTLDRFRVLYPNINIEIVLEELNVLEKYNRLGKLDVLIKNNYEEIDNFEVIKTFYIQDCFIASRRDFLDLEGKRLSLKELLEVSKKRVAFSKNSYNGQYQEFKKLLEENRLEDAYEVLKKCIQMKPSIHLEISKKLLENIFCVFILGFISAVFSDLMGN